MNFLPNNLFFQLAKIYSDNKGEDKVIICNEGGTRSSKTWDFFHFLVTFCDHNRNKGNDIYVLRDTLINCRDFTLKEFVTCLKVIGVYDPANFTAYPKPFYNLFGNNVYFRGLEDETDTEAYPSDILFFNESLEIRKSQFEGLKMRCRKLIVMDWNPKYTEHWCFDMEGQPNVFFTHSTYENNKHLQKSIIKEIESYEPWAEGSYEIKNRQLIFKGQLITEKNQPPPHPENVPNNTADEFRWKVYGLGLRGAMKGVIFPNVEYIDSFPDIAFTYGLDFGFTADPTALVKYAREGRNIYAELLLYQPIDNIEDMDATLEALGISKYVPITADSSDKYVSEKKGSVQMVRELFERGWEISKVSKTKGVMYWVTDMKGYKIHIIINDLVHHAKKEQENYRFKEVHGIQINQPNDSHNHFWDGCFVGGTMITTTKGQVPIRDIKRGDFVLTRKGYSRVLNLWDNGLKQTVEYSIQFDMFSLSLHCTPNHRVKTNKGWIEISRLESGMTVYLTKRSRAKRIDSTVVKDISAKAKERCIGMSGNYTTGSDEAGIISIILTETLGIITSKTLKKLRRISTYLSTLKIESKTILNGLSTLRKEGGRPPSYGIKAKKEGSGILSMVSSLGLIGNGTCEIANNAHVYTSQDTQVSQNSALITVNQNGEGSKDLTTSQSNVNGAEKNGHSASTLKQDSVQKFVVVKIDSKIAPHQNVYDLEVENRHEYFANGILVHNSRYPHMSHAVNTLEVSWS